MDVLPAFQSLKGDPCDHFFILATIHSSVSVLDEKSVKTWINSNLATYFGNVGASIDVDVLLCTSSEGSILLRVACNCLATVRVSLALSTTFGGQKCQVEVNKVSPILTSMASTRHLDLNSFAVCADGKKNLDSKQLPSL